LTIDFSGVSLPYPANEFRIAYVTASGDIELIRTAPQGTAISIAINKDGRYVLVHTVKPLETKVFAYPNPYKASRHGAPVITFQNTSPGDKIKIFTITGEKVYDKKITSYDFKWDIVNDYNYYLASGIYVYYIESQGKVFKGKIAIER